MLALSGVCEEVAALLRAGQVAAWRAGMAHYRPAALELCGGLNPKAVRAALGLPETTDVKSVLEHLRADPWFDPAETGAAASRRELKIVGRAGAFRGFGGLFLAPPRVACLGGQFIVSEGDDRWLLSADRFGATFHRTDHAARAGSLPTAFAVESGGRVVFGKKSHQFSEFESVTSWAANETTLAVTIDLSHAVYLVALAKSEADSHR
jgi:hypothetical protein